MSDYVFLVGDDYESSNKEYVSINSDKGKLISIALAASGIPFKGRFDKERMLFNYDGIYKESVDEIIAKFTSDDYAEQRNEIAEHKDGDCLYFLPAVAKLLRMTEGTLRRRPMDIQLAPLGWYLGSLCRSPFRSSSLNARNTVLLAKFRSFAISLTDG